MELINPKMTMLETALKKKQWKSCIDCLKRLSRADRKTFLQNHEVQDRPTLHYLAKFPMKEAEKNLINEIVKLFADSGYDINKKSKAYSFKGPTHLPASSEGYSIVDSTALIAAAAKGNNVLVKCLIRNGASKGLLDSESQSAFHLAISYGNLTCLKSLIYVRSARAVDETEQMKDLIYAYSLVQKAIECGRKEIVAFLIENKLCDLSEKAIVIMESGLRSLPDEEISTSLEMIPLQVAILKRQWDIATYLIKTGSDISIVACVKKEHGQYILSNSIIAGDINSYELLLKLGDKQALPVLDAMLEKGIEKALTWFRIDVLRVAVKENKPDFVERIFNHYTQDTLNCLSPTWLCTCLFTTPLVWNIRSPTYCFNRIPYNWHLSLGEYTMLHFACIHECSPEFVQKLIELGSDVNSTTTGLTKLTPLHISIIQRQWEHARVLIENGADLRSTAVFNRNVGSVHNIQSLNSIQMLLHLSTACNKCCTTTQFFLSLMDQEEKVSWVGVNEFAIVSGSPECVLKMLTHCAKTAPRNDLTWFCVDENPSCENVNPTSQIKLPLLHLVFSELTTCRCEHVPSYLCRLIRTLAVAPYNYDFNAVAEGITERMEINDQMSDYIFNTPLLFHALVIDLTHSNYLLTETLLGYDHVELNVRNQIGHNPVEYVLQFWSNPSFQHAIENDLQGKVNFVADAVENLILKGTDVTAVSINEEFRYHIGLIPTIKLLYRTGANITPSFFSPRPGFEPNSDDIQSLKVWKGQFDQQCKFSLKHRCRLFIRSSIKTVGHAKEVVKKLPKQLQNYILNLEESSQELN